MRVKTDGSNILSRKIIRLHCACRTRTEDTLLFKGLKTASLFGTYLYRQILEPSADAPETLPSGVEENTATALWKHGAFLWENNLFKTRHHGPCSKCLYSPFKQTSSLLKILLDSSLKSMMLIDVTVSLIFLKFQATCSNSLNTLRF
jgi:hypothetical protein